MSAGIRLSFSENFVLEPLGSKNPWNASTSDLQAALVRRREAFDLNLDGVFTEELEPSAFTMSFTVEQLEAIPAEAKRREADNTGAELSDLSLHPRYLPHLAVSHAASRAPRCFFGGQRRAKAKGQKHKPLTSLFVVGVTRFELAASCMLAVAAIYKHLSVMNRLTVQEP